MLIHFISLTVRRLFPAVMLAAAAMVTGSALGGPAIACASPKWDMDGFYGCWDPINEQYNAGDITNTQYNDRTETCCLTHGGRYDWDTHLCTAPAVMAPATPVAPPSEAANPDVPSGSTPSTTKPPKTTFTLAPIAPVG